ncbi:putative microsomal signal peptidase 12kDa subunit [Lupinus albus]|uniref:Signal peptidase complex subunit 1 n=1 Tax=Lupinus albus TaxID=3870 RepID=A0A6A4NMZ4_LUPAL|nr:putative microsomal signal peptidase 12kDa subunit [Lupinus albus]
MRSKARALVRVTSSTKAYIFLASFQLMILTCAGGVVLTILVIVPNWPFFNRHPLKWLDPN